MKKTKLKSYTENDVLNAIAEIQAGTLKYRQAAQKYKVPISTLCDKIKHRIPLVPSRTGPRTNLSDDQEWRLVNWLLTMSKIGYGISRNEIPFLVKDLLNKAERDGYVIEEGKKFIENKPSKNWVARFLARHPQISPRTPENLGFQRTFVTENKIREWFDDLQKFLLNEHQIHASDFFKTENAHRVFNIDESGFPLQGTNHRLQVIAEKGSKNIYRVAPDTKEQVTVLACVAANGAFENPLVVFPGVRTPKFTNLDSVNPDNYSLGYSANGWMNTSVFFTWFSSVFYEAIKDRVEFPVIIFLDGHTSHINLEISDFCQERNIILYCFLPHASFVMQPLDVSIFGPLKKKWNKSIDDFRTIHRVSITRSHFFPVFDKAWKSAVASPQNVMSGFKSCGLIPFNVENINYGKLLNATSANKAYEDSNPTNHLSQAKAYERLGMIKIFQVIERSLSNDVKRTFENRIEEDYDLEDDTHKGMLWKIYRGATDALKNIDVNNNENDQNNVENITTGSDYDSTKRATNESRSVDSPNIVSLQTISSPTAVTESTLPVPRMPLACLAAEPEQPDPTVATSSTTNIMDIGQPGPSGLQQKVAPETPTRVRVENYNYSPFKKYLVIPEKLSSGKKSKTNVKVPYAVSGKDFMNNQLRIQREKEKLEEEKENRKREREAKKLLKLETKKNKVDKKGKKRLFPEEEDNLIDEITYVESDSDMEELQDFDSCCYACLANDNLNEPNCWIGCNKCPRWFHKSCLSDDIEQMSSDELAVFNFICQTCSKQRKCIKL